ncbi:hypothetical protein BDV28DRAFT_131277 [Aspergillus coremiiformis]|uniref:Uncharacterized protein n=1 Tax=Aspergillus coremiiformis TaxID=138285 RepID=A0A5N6ZAU4_9EURO|nr:hypothetical protein BDV28DRAFT_131277 [Aspergillus coremiiformis]
MPDILYQFEPEDKRDRKSDPPRMSYTIHGQHLRDLPILPDNIASTVEEFRVEAWMRLDRRIRLRDITDRMHPDFRIQDNALQQRSVRFRQHFSLIAWDSGNKRSQNIKQEVVRKLWGNGIDTVLNTTRGLTPGLIDPNLGEEGGRIPLPNQYNKEKRVARGRRPSKTPVQETAMDNTIHEEQSADFSGSVPEELLVAGQVHTPEGPAAMEPAPVEFCFEDLTPETVSDLFNFVPVSVPFDVSYDSADGPLPIITGLIPDNELPETIKMEDINLTMSAEDPVPRHNTETALRPIAPGRIERNRPSPLKLVPGRFCDKACPIGKIATPMVTGLTLWLDSADENESFELPLPSQGLSPDVLIPYSEADVPSGVRDQFFDNLFEQCLSGDKYLFDIPAMTSPDLEMMSLGDINDINIDDYFPDSPSMIDHGEFWSC